MTSAQIVIAFFLLNFIGPFKKEVVCYNFSIQASQSPDDCMAHSNMRPVLLEANRCKTSNGCSLPQFFQKPLSVISSL